MQVRQHAPIDEALEANEQQRKLFAKDKIASQISKVTPNTSKTTSQPMQKDSASNNSTTILTYEKPDNGFMMNTTRKLGHLREIELITIASDERIQSQNQSTINNTTHKKTGEGFPIVDPIRQQKE